MKLISHRGNFKGKEPLNENHPDYIRKAIDHGFEVEIDVWFVERIMYGRREIILDLLFP